MQGTALAKSYTSIPLPNPVIFREYDIRGTVEEELTESIAFAIGRAFGERIGSQKQVCVAYDGRLSSPALAKALAHGLVKAGCRVLRLGLGPTPMLYFGVCFFDVDAGIMVTGSHNPPDQNGFKFMCRGQPFFGDDIRNLYQAILENNNRMPVDCSEWPRHENREVIRRYYLHHLLSISKREKRTLKVAWDPGNGAAGDVVRGLTLLFPGTHVCINDTIDGTFPAHHPDPSIPANLEQLKALVKKEGCDIGFAFDGDGDRLGVIDDTGEIVGPDQLLMLYAADVLQKHPGAIIIADVKSSQALFDEIRRLGGQPLMWKTGHSLIKAKLKETAAPLAGEQSGHIFFADEYYGFDDAIYAALRLLRLLAQSSVSLSQWRKTLPKQFSTPELRLPCAEHQKFFVVEGVRRQLEEEGAIFIDIDGVRTQRPQGWWLLRASNTQPMLIARCESDHPQGLTQLMKEMRQRLAGWNIEFPVPMHP